MAEPGHSPKLIMGAAYFHQGFIIGNSKWVRKWTRSKVHLAGCEDFAVATHCRRALVADHPSHETTGLQ